MTIPEPEVRPTRQHIATQWHIIGRGSVLKCKCGDWKSDPSQTAPQQREAHRDHREAMGETVHARQKKTGPEVRITRYEVSCLPEDDINARSFTLAVEYRGRGLWAVMDGPFCLGTDGEWDYEMRPSDREDGWLAAHRFDLDTALRLAKEAAPEMTVNGWTVSDALARIAEREAKG